MQSKASPLTKRFMAIENKIKGLIQQQAVTKVRAPEMHLGVVRELLMELDVYFQANQKLLYPFLKTSVQDISLQGTIVEHFNSIAELEILRENALKVINSTKEEEQVSNLTREVEDFFKTQEQTVLPVVHHMDLTHQEKLSKEMDSLEKTIQSQSKYRDSIPYKVQNPNGGEQKRISNG